MKRTILSILSIILLSYQQVSSAMMPSPFALDALAISAGAAAGAYSRYSAGKIATEQIARDPKRFGALSGWHTAGINVVGSFILGGVFGTPNVNIQDIAKPSSSSTTRGLTPRQKLLFGVGFCGSFTTFSTYSVDIVNMIGKGEITKALAYGCFNNFGGIAAAATGMVIAKSFFRK